MITAEYHRPAVQEQLLRKALLQVARGLRAQQAPTGWAHGHEPRDKQSPPPGAWHIWLVLAGRGWGKTRVGAEWVRSLAESGQARRIALVAPTRSDARDVMIEGHSGILSLASDQCRPIYEVSKRRVTWPNGAIATTYSAEEPERLRGPQHDAAWFDEPGASRNAQETWDMLMMGLRIGAAPRCLVTSTPKPIELFRDLVRRAESGADVVLTRGSSYENREHLAPAFLDQIVSRYEGTRLGRQELYAELLDQAEGALWQREWFDQHRRYEATRLVTVPTLRRTVVAIDPAASSGEASDETGVVAAGIGEDGRGYVLRDVSGRCTPDGWARRAIRLYDELRANVIVAEKNNGGDMVQHTIRTTAEAMHRAGDRPSAHVPVVTVWASHGKAARAEPVAALYEQGRISHVGTFAQLEDQCCTWEPQGQARSPDRLDALVWAMTELMLGRAATTMKVVGF